MYVCTYVCARVCAHACMPVILCAWMCACMYACLHTVLHTYIHMHDTACMQMDAYMFAFMHVCLRGRAHNYEICVHIICILVNMSECSSACLCDRVSLICIMSSDSLFVSAVCLWVHMIGSWSFDDSWLSSHPCGPLRQ